MNTVERALHEEYAPEPFSNEERLKEIDAELARLRALLEQEYVSGMIEVYDRIVGYYRPLAQWNAGKSSELKERVRFKWPDKK